MRTQVIGTVGVFGFVLLALCGDAFGEDETPAGKIVVTVTGFEGDAGRSCVWLHASEKTWSTDLDGTVRRACGKIRDNRSTLVFDGVPLGDYAALAFHDADGNGRMKTNWIGIPKEGVGVSNNPKGGIGGPSFEDGRFVLDAAKKSLIIRLRYL
jgi:uncharacterized protein (DUF2141 family)